MTADHQKVLGNFGPKPHIVAFWQGEARTYTFDFPSVGVIADMEKLVKEDARQTLLESRELLTAEDYATASREYVKRLSTGYFKGPKGEGFVRYFDFQGEGGIAAFVGVVLCLLAPNHPGIGRDEVLNLLREKMPEVQLVLTELMPKAMGADTAAGAAGPKAGSGVGAA